jgi:hypothetical protein
MIASGGSEAPCRRRAVSGASAWAMVGREDSGRLPCENQERSLTTHGEEHMRRCWRTRAAWLLLAGAGLLSACASGSAVPAEPSTQVAIGSLGEVTGRWDGLLSGLSPRPYADEDFVEVVIKDDSTYEAKSVRTIGVLQGRGTLELKGGVLLLSGERGAKGTARLLSGNGRRLLEVETILPDGRRVTARLSPKR